MTVFGIGGCMALMLVGYGVRDSVYEIADIQYEEIQLYDGHIFYKDDVTKTEKEELKEYLKTDSDIQSYMEAETSECKRRGYHQSEEGNGEECHCKDCAYL